jgi:hypothetical protein
MLSLFCVSVCGDTRGLSLLVEVGIKPLHDGMRRMGRYNLLAGSLPLSAEGSADLTNSPHPSSPWGHVSVRAERVFSLPAVFAFFPAGSGNCKSAALTLLQRNSLPVEPHPVENYGQGPGDRDDGSRIPRH